MQKLQVKLHLSLLDIMAIVAAIINILIIAAIVVVWFQA